MAIVNKAYTFTNGQTSDGTQVNQDFDNLYTLVNGNIDSANLKALGIATSNIAAEAVTPAKTEGIPYSTDLYGSTGFVQSGLTATKDGTTLSQVNITTGIIHVAQADGTLRRFASAATNFRTTAATATYYLDFNPDGTWSWNTSHSTQTNYVTIATVTSDASSNVNVITDTRPTNVNLLSNATGPLALSTQVLFGTKGSVKQLSDGSVLIESKTNNLIESSPIVTQLGSNAYYDGTAYQRYNTANAAALLEVSYAYQRMKLYLAAAGANPITWTSYDVPQILSGGYKIHSGTIAAVSSGTYTVTFPTAFTSAPVVVASYFTNGVAGTTVVSLSAISATAVTFSMGVGNNGGNIQWYAIGS